MTEPEIRYLGDVQRLVLNPGDKVVLTCDSPLAAESAENLLRQLRKYFPGNEAFILADGMKIGVLAQG